MSHTPSVPAPSGRGNWWRRLRDRTRGVKSIGWLLFVGSGIWQLVSILSTMDWLRTKLQEAPFVTFITTVWATVAPFAPLILFAIGVFVILIAPDHWPWERPGRRPPIEVQYDGVLWTEGGMQYGYGQPLGNPITASGPYCPVDRATLHYRTPNMIHAREAADDDMTAPPGTQHRPGTLVCPVCGRTYLLDEQAPKRVSQSRQGARSAINGMARTRMTDPRGPRS